MLWLKHLHHSHTFLNSFINVARLSTSCVRHTIFKSQWPDVQIPNRSLVDHILGDSEKNKDLVAVVDGETGVQYKYSDVKACIHRVASALTKRGFKKGDVLTLCVENCADALFVHCGTQAVGGAVHLISPASTEDELSRQMSLIGSRLLVTTELQADTAMKAAHMSKNVEDIYVIGGPTPNGCRPISDMLEDDGSASPWGQVEINPHDVAVMPHSSGTSGLPKIVQLTNYSTVSNVIQFADISDIQTGVDRLLLILPFIHVYGFTLVSCVWYRGGAIVTLPRFDPVKMFETIERHKVTYLPAVPPIILFLTQSEMVDRYDLSSVQRCLCAAAPLLEETQVAFTKKFPNIEIFQGYGLTEASPVISFTPRRHLMPSPKYGTSGILVPNTELRVLKIGTGEELGVNQEGEIAVRGPQVMKGYLNAQEETAAMIKDGWLHTGDIGKMDEDGYLFITDRVKELIKYKGLQVAPAELEDLLLTHPNVQDCGVIGKKDERAGELPMAFVVKKGSVTEDELYNFVAERIHDSSHLRGGITFVEEIPKSPSGKILRRLLRDRVNR